VRWPIPTYDYFCDKCDERFDLIKSIHDHKPKEPCPKCGKMSSQDLSLCRPEHIGASVKDAYKCPALGTIVKSDAHRKELARAKGLEEIGNEKPKSIHRHFEKQREDKINKSWDEV